MNTSDRRTAARAPWATLALAASAGVLALWPAANGVALYARDAILGGEFWRLATGQLAHFGASHFLWNIVVVLPAGLWLERLNAHRARIFLAVAPWFIGLTLLAFDPALQIYAGLSGVATGVFAMLALELRRGTRADRGWSLALLALLAIKSAVELIDGTPTFVEFETAGIRTVPLAHGAGLALALAISKPWRRTDVSGQKA